MDVVNVFFSYYKACLGSNIIEQRNFGRYAGFILGNQKKHRTRYEIKIENQVDSHFVSVKTSEYSRTTSEPAQLYFFVSMVLWQNTRTDRNIHDYIHLTSNNHKCGSWIVHVHLHCAKSIKVMLNKGD